MARAKIATITGTVTDENGQKLNGWAFVDLFTYPESGKLTHENKWDYWAEVLDMSYDESDGTYKIKVKPGDYVLSVGGDSGDTHYNPQFYVG